jgi:hypothetical protein
MPTLRISHHSENTIKLVMVVWIASFNVFLPTQENRFWCQQLSKYTANCPDVCSNKANKQLILSTNSSTHACRKTRSTEIDEDKMWVPSEDAHGKWNKTASSIFLKTDWTLVFCSFQLVKATPPITPSVTAMVST